MTTIDSAAFLARARAAIGTSIIPQGMCLNFVWRMAGGLSSIGNAVGRLDTAYNSWLAADDKHPGDRHPPAGVALHYGPSPTRTDRNRNAGDVTVSIGGGLQIATDVTGARVGIMTIAAREKQTQRPYLGWTGDLGGHAFSVVSATLTPAAVAVAIINNPEGQHMFIFDSDKGQIGMVGGQAIRLKDAAEVNALGLGGAKIVKVPVSLYERLFAHAWG
ncbi:hypothetical protein EDF18_0982 [Frigoribacterium sp. PhB107]|uniref:hypothetical protein n=1 Tax=Frigoribacterium sp. PhB107 TaxID=2485172 RepID=UPI000F4A3B78|nr:hypothetical protein [Frigoribacterium sp. PhB107]ROP78336.1 hypothetical protein EDF18_0982 [Frigoribacterium sp. PhB107]